MNAPCKNCDRRSVTCHDFCKEYKAYDAERKAISKDRMKEKRADVPNYSGFGHLMEIPDRNRRLRR